MGVQNSSGSGFTPIFFAVSVAIKSAGAPESIRKLNGPLPLIRTDQKVIRVCQLIWYMKLLPKLFVELLYSLIYTTR